MITTILEKCLSELRGTTPDLSYIRGMLEVLLASQPNAPIKFTAQSISPSMTCAGPVAGVIKTEVPMDEGQMMDAKARAALETIKALSQSND